MRIKEFKLEKYFAKYEFTAKYLLCSSDCESFSVKELSKIDASASVVMSIQNSLVNWGIEEYGSEELKQKIEDQSPASREGEDGILNRRNAEYWS